MKRTLAVLLAIGPVGPIGAQFAHARDLDVRALAAGCASCHQPTQSVPPPLAGQPREALVAKLRGFRDGTLAGSVMPRIANGYSQAELDALARYFTAHRAPK